MPQRPLTVAFASSDPYLSRVASFGRWDVSCPADLEALVRRERAGALLFVNHPSQTPCDEADQLQLWTNVRQALERAGEASPVLHELPSALFCCSDETTPQPGSAGEDESVVEAEEKAGWKKLHGLPSAPGHGSAATQLQHFLDKVCGGWANSFG